MTDPSREPGIIGAMEAAGGPVPGAGRAMITALLSAYAATPQVRTMAVVGNAPLEPDADRAAAIDGCDLVIRCNSFMLDKPGEPPTQGSVVHAVAFSRGLLPTEFSFARYRDVAYLVTEPSRIYHQAKLARYVKDWPAWWPADLGYVAVPNADFAVPLLDDLVGERWRSEVVVPTTGTMAAYLALACFPEAELLVTGFSMIDDPDQTEWAHQAGDTSPIGGAHEIGPEGHLFKRWIDEGRVRRL